MILLGLSGSLMVCGLSFRELTSSAPFSFDADSRSTGYFYDTIDAAGILITFNQAVGLWLWSSALVDVSVSVTLFMGLRSKRVGFNATTDSVLSRMIHIAVATASYTAVLAVVGAVLGVAFDEDNLMTTE